MDPWQFERQVADRVARVAWADAPVALVLTGGAVVSRDGLGNFLPYGPRLPGGGPAVLAPPYAVVGVVDAEPDRRQPGRFERVRARVRVVAGRGGVTTRSGDQSDDHGLEAVAGGNRDPAQGQGKSKGRGVDEVVGRLLESLLADGGGQLVHSTHGFLAALGAVGPIIPVDGVQVVAREFDVDAFDVLTSRGYDPPRKLAAVGGAGQISLSWALPPARFDTITTLVLRRAAGAVPPSSPTAGAGVALAAGATSKVDVGLAPGTYSYALFQPYDETSAAPTTADRYSAAATATAAAT